jgi:hypothetical protein
MRKKKTGFHQFFLFYLFSKNFFTINLNQLSVFLHSLLISFLNSGKNSMILSSELKKFLLSVFSFEKYSTISFFVTKTSLALLYFQKSLNFSISDFNSILIQKGISHASGRK